MSQPPPKLRQSSSSGTVYSSTASLQAPVPFIPAPKTANPADDPDWPYIPLDEHDEEQMTAGKLLIDYSMAELDAITQRLSALDTQIRQFDFDEVVQKSRRERMFVEEAKEEKDTEKEIFLTGLDVPLQRFMEEDEEIVAPLHPGGAITSSIMTSIVTVAKYPGFSHDAPTLLPLPDGMNAADCLLEITKFFKFEPTMPKKEWTALFQCRYSVDIMQDTFWYFWCQLYMTAYHEKERRQSAMDNMFDRIAANYTELFSLLREGFKDDFFQRYPNAMCQAVYLAFSKCFPQSVYTTFGDAFKESLCNLVFNWMTGCNPPPRVWESWPQQLLPEHKDALQYVHEVASEANAALEGLGEEIVGIYNPMASQGPQYGDPVMKAHASVNVVKSEMFPQPPKTRRKEHFSRWTGNMLRRFRRPHPDDPIRAVVASVRDTRDKVCADDNDTDDVVRTPRDQLIAVPFNITGNTPLIAHHLRKRGQLPAGDRAVIVQRTESSEVPRRPVYFTESTWKFERRAQQARFQLRSKEAESASVIRASTAKLREEQNLIDRAAQEVLTIPDVVERRLEIRKCVDELVVRLLPELTMSWVEEVAGSDAALRPHRDSAGHTMHGIRFGR